MYMEPKIVQMAEYRPFAVHTGAGTPMMARQDTDQKDSSRHCKS